MNHDRKKNKNNRISDRKEEDTTNLLFDKRKRVLLYLDKILIVFFVILLGVFPPDKIVMFVYLFLYPYLLLTKRNNALYHLGISSIIALVWVIIAQKDYGYNQAMFSILGLNSFPLFAWACGLFVAHIIYSHWEHKIKNTNGFKKIILFTAIYWPLLILLETTGYYLFDIKNLATAAYPGLPICNCMHAPVWIQTSYFLMGPVYFIICELLRLENPHIEKHQNK